TYDAANTTMRIFLNGQQAAIFTDVTGTILPGIEAPTIGAIRQQGEIKGPFSGNIDEVQLWNIARSPAEIAQDYNRALVGTEPGLLGYWKLNEHVGSQALDSGPGG